MTSPALRDAPDIPVFRLDDVHQMQAELLAHAERVLGPRSHGFTIAPARFTNGTTGCTARIGDAITIHLEINAAGDWPCCATVLGHELVHALDGLTGHPTWLEEGVACLFGIGQCAAMFGHAPTRLCNGRYLDALRMVTAIPDVFAVVKSLRARGVRFPGITPRHLMDAAPGVDPQTAEALCARFEHATKIGAARVHDHGR